MVKREKARLVGLTPEEGDNLKEQPNTIKDMSTKKLLKDQFHIFFLRKNKHSVSCVTLEK
jgi:hypothetical protein